MEGIAKALVGPEPALAGIASKFTGSNARTLQASAKAKRLHGLGSGVMEVAVNDASGTCHAVYTVSIGDSIYVVDAFQKKSKSGIATPKPEIELVRQRLKQLRSEVEQG